MSIYQLTTHEFTELLENGTLYKLFPELQGRLFNVQQFVALKAEYELNDALYNFLFDIVEYTGCDPAEFYELFIEHKESILNILQHSDELNVEGVLAKLREDV